MNRCCPFSYRWEYPVYSLYEGESEKVAKSIGSIDLNQSPIFINWDFCPMKYLPASCTVKKRIQNEFSLNSMAKLISSL